MQRIIEITNDGSQTVRISGTNITYHSTFGAIQESMHIFIKCGLEYLFHRDNSPQNISIFEAGLGTGLNALLTAYFAEKNAINIQYTASEIFPLNSAEIEKLHYPITLNSDIDILKTIHESQWEITNQLTSNFTFTKTKSDIENIAFHQQFDLIYFDAFAPNHQPELWSVSVFERMFASLKKNGVLVTYCSKSIVRKNMINAGFTVTKLPGPPGKREILSALKQ